MIDRLIGIKNRYDELTKELMDPEVISNINKTTEISKEIAELEETVRVFDEYNDSLQKLEEAKLLESDPDIGEMAKLEIDELNEIIPKLEDRLQILLIPVDKEDGKDVIVEIRGAAGGDEANIFAGDLFRMYQRYCDNNNFKIEILNSMDSSAGGFSQIEFMVRGTNVYSKLKYESGSHRVQRIPKTESSGRLQTSTATVAVLPEAEDVDVNIEQKDLKIDVYRASGAGGQHVNTTDSAVRITHIPTGVVVTCQQERSQIKNRERALSMLKTKLYEEERIRKEEEEGALRKNKIGTGDRAEKIRTYNYPQNRVTDHRIGFTTKNLDRVMDGELDEIIEALINEDQRLKLEGQELES